jgi:hypothetical protein
MGSAWNIAVNETQRGRRTSAHDLDETVVAFDTWSHLT